MGVDLNSLVSQYLTPQVVSQIASTAGVDPDSAQKLISGAIPAVLASLGGAIALPGGAQKVSDAISNADPDMLTKMSTALGSGDVGPLDAGANALGSLIGTDGLSKLANALGDHAGIPPEAAQSAVGAVSQAVIGVIGQQDPSNWSDSASIANFIASQKSSILAALPGNLSSALGASTLLGGLGAAAAAKMTQAASSATATASNAASSAMRSASAPMQQAQSAASGSGFPMWLIVIIVLAIIAGVGYYFYMQKEKAMAPKASMAPGFIELALTSANLA